MNNELIRIQVSGIRESDKSIGALVEIILNDHGECCAAGRLVWFPRSLCTLEIIPKKENHNWDSKFITAPKWFLERNKIKYNDKGEKKKTND